MLDTDTVSFALRGEGMVAKTLLSQHPSDIAVSAITVAELRFGAHKRGSRRLHRMLDTFLQSVQELSFGSDAADRYGRLAMELRTQGLPIGLLDTMIAAHALVAELTLVSHNARHFQRISGLSTVDWY